MNLTFCKNERLCSEKLLETLFASGERMVVFPYSVRWMLVPQETLPAPAQVLIATSKRKFRHAVDRNRVKRLTRECYRQHKPVLYESLNNQQTSLLLAINYIHSEILPYSTLYHKFEKITYSLISQITQIGGGHSLLTDGTASNNNP